MKIISTFFLLFTGIAAMAQSTYEVLKDPKNGQVVFKGPVTFDDLQKEPSFDWLKSGIENCHTSARKIKYLKKHLTPDNYKLVVFMGTWCSDTHEMLPKFFKVLREINYPAEQAIMYGVERNKETRSADVKKYNITNLPTIVVLDKTGAEKGRITETVKKSVEMDLVRIVNP